jgi:hypothetical protein
MNQNSEEIRNKIEEANKEVASLKKELEIKNEQIHSLTESSQQSNLELKSKIEQITEFNKKVGIFEGFYFILFLFSFNIKFST